MTAAVDSASSDLRLALIKAHPISPTRPSAPLASQLNPTPNRNSVGLDRLSDAEYEAFERVNNAYRSKFGFPLHRLRRRRTKIPSCAISNAACRTMPRPKRRNRSRKSAGSQHCASTSS